MRPIALLLSAALAFACRLPPESSPTGPYVVVLGTAQDAGLPQIGCTLPCCREARADSTLRRLVSALLLVDPRDGRRWLFDATPDLREQVVLAEEHAGNRQSSGSRPPLFDGIFLTHAHMGHYSGLLQLGREAYNAHALPLHVSPSMEQFLRNNDPWRYLLSAEHFTLMPLNVGQALPLSKDLSVEALSVPHRAEFTDTLAFVIRGPRRALLFLPDIDKWERWETPVEQWIERVDVALLDGTFYADGEVPGRSLKDIPHPFICESLERFAALPLHLRQRIYFTHLNHSNPAAHPRSAAQSRIEAAGLQVAADGLRFDL